MDYSNPQDRLDNYFGSFILMRDKDAILRSIAEDIKKIEAGTVREGHSEAFWQQLLSLLRRFRRKVEDTLLFFDLEEYWCYSYEISEVGAKLILEYIVGVDYDDFDEEGEPVGKVDITPGQTFDLVTVPAKLLSVEQYAAVYGVGVTTVRQWIRRGKLRSAIKNGREWSIPELAEVSGRGYQSISYSWEPPLHHLPEEFAFLRDAKSVYICQNAGKKDIYDISIFPGRDGRECKFQMPTSDKEKLELMLISHPLVEADIRPILVRC